MVADPQELRAGAHRLRDSAATVRELAVRVGLTRDVQWRSAAADVFRHRVDDATRRLHRTAGHLEAAAECLDRHARGVEQTLAVLHQAAALVGSGIESLSDVPGHVFDLLHALDALHVLDPSALPVPRWTW